MRHRKILQFSLALLLIFSLILPGSLFVSSASAAEEAVLENNFDDGTEQGWIPRGSVTLKSVTETASSGTHSLKTTGATASWNGPSLNATEILDKGATYLISGQVKLVKGKPASKLKFTVERKPTNGDTGYDQVNSPVEVTDAAWVKLEGEYSYTDNVSALLLYVESDDPTSEFYLDDVKITLTKAAPPGAADPEPVDESLDQSGIQSDFEDNTVQGWESRIGVEKVEVTTADAHSGTHSLLTTGREQPYSAPKIDATNKIHRNSKYNVSVWVKLAPGEQPTNFRLSLQRDLNGESSYDTIVGNTEITADNWVELKGSYTLGSAADAVTVYVETAEGTQSYYIDDFSLTHASGRDVQLDIPSIAEHYSGQFEIGAAINPIQTEGKYSTFIKKQYNVIVAENAMKPGPMQPTEGNFFWDDADKLVKFGKDNGIPIRFHTLVWHSQAAEWMFLDKDGNPMQPTEENKKLLLDRMETHIRTIAVRYKDVIRDWDVVNEVIDEGQPDGMRNSIWYQITGTEYIERAFRVTREVAGEDAKLYINDYNTHAPRKRDFLYDLVTKLLDKGVPIDGVGHQTHINIVSPPISQMRESIEKFAALGLDNQITELDVSIYANDSDSYDVVPEDVLIKQAYRYKEVFDMFSELKDSISSVILWGTDDSGTWLKTFPITRINLPLLFDENMQAKYAYWALVDIDRVPPPPVEVVIEKQQTKAVNGKPVIDGEMDAIWSKTPEVSTDIWVTGNSGATAKVRTLWEDGYLYVYANVTDSKLSKASPNVWEQDSFEIFVDQNNAQTDAYQADDAQFRVNFENEQSYGGAASADNFTTATKVVPGGYVVEAAIKLDPAFIKEGAKIGFDLQVNNDEDGNGTRDSVAIWSDPTGASFQNTQNFGALELVKGSIQSTSKVHIVKSGENLSKIAQQYGLTWQDLQKLNQLKNPNLIHPNQEIRLP